MRAADLALGGADRARAAAWRAAVRLGFGEALLRSRDPRIAVLAFGHLFVAAAATLFAPVWLLLLGPLLLGVPHIVSDFRYLVVDRQRPLAPGARVAIGLPLVVLIGARITAALEGWELSSMEIACGLAAMASGVLIASRGISLRAIALLAGLAILAALSLPRAIVALIALSQIHNVVALLFWLREWSRRIPPRASRTAAIAVFTILYAGFAAAILSGALDTTLAWRPAGGLDAGALSQSLAPGVRPELATRLVALFAFGQAVHYAIWLRLLPQTLAESHVPARFRTGLASLSRDFGRGGVALIALLTVALPLAGLAAPVAARDAYLMLAGFHAWMELAVFAHRAAT